VIGVIIFISHIPEEIRFEITKFRSLIASDEKINEVFVSGLNHVIKGQGFTAKVKNRNDEHLLVNAQRARTFRDMSWMNFRAEDAEYTEDELLGLLEESPEIFSNNVVTRHLMKEMMFNTLIFLGGNVEVKYWGELHKVFEVMEVEMPIVLKRIEFEYLSPRLEKMMKKHELEFNPQFYDTVDKLKRSMVADDVNADFINKIH